jgi:hypothetical protein
MALLIKSVNGLAYGSCKSRNGLAVASIKSINGLDATSSGATISDDFNRANSDTLGTGWTEHAGDTDIFSNTARFATGSFAKCLNTHSTSLGSDSGYCKMTLVTTPSGGFPGFVFRFTDASSPYYSLDFDVGSNGIYWSYYPNVAGSGTDIGSDPTAAFTDGMTVGITWEGTGNSTVLRVWFDPSANAPTSVSSWDGASDPADYSMTDDPGTAVNSGTLVGIECFQSDADSTQVDDFYAGPL